ncbi:calmodulin-binding protein 60 A-like isoform X2 [Magnolia sinica]|uniref:calmodulin-binding protein 60 A-like isoform X2 n=1 Tax=Magnolia sinica TaxID=86752 RepID=UPI0026580A79|nr:calmodulin-binding protein 60 A-like isoform X2 [Magnolia sinica]
MSQKRPRDDDEQARSDGRSVTSEAKEAYKNEELLSSLKPHILELVRKEVERLQPERCACKKRCCGNQMDNSASRSLQLKFINKLTLPSFTMENVNGEDSSVPSIALVDAQTEQIVKSGPESSMNLEMVLLEGHFKGNDDGNWTSIQFSNHIVREREGKRPLLIGDVSLTLNEGIAVAHELKITDNSSWTRSRAFRLAARVGDGYFDGMRVKETITEPFVVKENRGKSYQKKHPPSLDNEVWSLEEIGRDGNIHKRLKGENINTVKDFLIKLHTDTPRLQNILRFRINDKRWEVIKNHAEECDLGSETYVYYSKVEWGKGVVFNIVRAVKGFLFEGRFIPIKDLPEIQKKTEPFPRGSKATLN